MHIVYQKRSEAIKKIKSIFGGLKAGVHNPQSHRPQPVRNRALQQEMSGWQAREASFIFIYIAAAP